MSNNPDSPRVRTHGKFLVAGNEKLYIRGVTYGTFKTSVDGTCDYERSTVRKDFEMMVENGVNTVRVYTTPPRWLLDIAHEFGLYVMVGLPWEQHINFLDSSDGIESIEKRIRENVRTCANHPALLCFAIGNEIPAANVRWYGHRRIERFLRGLYGIAKQEDPDALVTYVNFPSTEYLNLPFLDFVCFNVYLEDPHTLDAYLSRLQNIAGDKPLVMGEIGLDSIRNGLDEQAETLDWQVRTAFAAGCAGAFVFSWTDEWHRGGSEILDWDFGLVTRSREPKPALLSVKNAFAEIPFAASFPFPKISVVVCSYNGSRTIRDCFEGLLLLDYPDYEVIVVDDGSTDNTASIAAEYPFRLISTANKGLSSARNTGLYAATGEIVAYTDDDAHPDPHWLKYLAATFAKTNHVGVGGPNIAPCDDGLIAECVANAPGGPIHVLLSDTEAEHIPGCNMAFRRENLLAIGGFDVQYRNAGDDVDICWRLQEMGWTLGFSPAAMVWHHRRNSVRDYWKQQQGYGKAEALLERKWADKYNSVGHLTWEGRLYGKGFTEALHFRRGRVYQGIWGSALFQSVYEPSGGFLSSLPLMPEWYLVGGTLAFLSILGIFWHQMLVFLPLLAIALIAPAAQAALSGYKAVFLTKVSRGKDLQLRCLTAFLHLLQPVARLRGRLNHGLSPWRLRGASAFGLPIPKTLVYWSENWQSFDERLRKLESYIRDEGAIVYHGNEFDNKDLWLRGGMFGGTYVRTLNEEHGAGKQVLRVRITPTITKLVFATLALLCIVVVLAFWDGESIVAASIGIFALLIGIRAIIETSYTSAIAKKAVCKLRESENGIALGRNGKTQVDQSFEIEFDGPEIADSKRA